MSKPFVTRFAPSPSGYLHLGHAYSALLGFRAAKAHEGQFLVRIEDIDIARSKAEFETAIFDDLAWLGLIWEMPVRRQADHFDDYRGAIENLKGKGVVYPCFCTRKDIAREIERSANAPHGPESPLYPGTCRELEKKDREDRMSKGVPFALRLDVEKARSLVKGPLFFNEKGKDVEALPETLGDVVLARKDIPTSYHLSVVVDDALQDITHVIRGEDLLHATHVHRLLQALLGLDVPVYHHHPLLTGPDGKRFAKRDKAKTLRAIRESGKAPDDVFSMIEASGGDLSKLPFCGFSEEGL